MKRRILSAIIALCLLISCSACVDKEAQLKAEKKKLYDEAVAALKEMEPNEEGMYEVTEDLVVALANADYTEPKNIIYMIGDGMGFNIIEAAQCVYQDSLYNDTLAMNYLPVQSAQATYSATDQVTDSAAGATALATGYKTMNRAVSISVDSTKNYKTVLELAAEQGKDTGIIATKSVTDATPAAFTAHVASRSMQEEIAVMQLEKLTDGTLDLALGGGFGYFESNTNNETLTKAQQDGVSYVKSWDNISSAKLPVLGLFAENMMDTTDEALPTVAEMTTYALDVLSQDEDGFFLMVEGSQIDTYGEHNEFERETKELYDFDCAVAVAMRYVALHPDTVLIVTADHETGDVTVPMNPTAENIKETFYTTGSHTYKTVPVLAAGYGTESLYGIQENVDIGMFVASLLGEEEFGHKSTRHLVLDKKESTDGTFTIPLDKLEKTFEEIKNARVLHVTIENEGEELAALPELQLTHNEREYIVEPQIDYLDEGETIIASYVLPAACWKANQLRKVTEMVLTTNDVKSELAFSEFYMTEREMTK